MLQCEDEHTGNPCCSGPSRRFFFCNSGTSSSSPIVITSNCLWERARRRLQRARQLIMWNKWRAHLGQETLPQLSCFLWDFFFPNILATPSEESEREQREANSRDELTLERRRTAGHTQIRRSVFGVPQSKSGNRLFLLWKKKKRKESMQPQGDG